MNPDRYLERIGYRGPRDPCLRTLRRLHTAHMYSVPFENLDIAMRVPIVLSLPSLFEKVVLRRRGGFCYELNGLFAWLLRELGFDVTMLSARVFDDSTPGPEFDHMVLLVDTGERVIADVGFGDSFVEPLVLKDEVQPRRGTPYRLAQEHGDWVLARQGTAVAWEPQYSFSLQPRRLHEFRPMCRYHQTSPDSLFTRQSVCSRASEDGRLTLSADRFIVTSHGDRHEHAVADPETYLELLRIHFGIDLGDDVDPAVFMASSAPAE